MLSPVAWPKGTGVETVTDITLNCCNPFQFHVVGITISGTTQTCEGQALQEAVQVQQ